MATMEIEMTLMTSREDEEAEDEAKLIDAASEYLSTPEGAVNDLLTQNQRRRLGKLFNVSDRDQKGYLTQEELTNLFGKLHSVMPHSDLIKLTSGDNADSNKITWPQFLHIFAIAKGSQIPLYEGKEKGLPEQFGTYLLKFLSKSHAVKKASHAVTAHPENARGSEYDYEAYADGNSIVLVNNREHRKLEWTKAGAIFRAALIGAFFSSACGITEFFISQLWGYDGDIGLSFNVPVTNVVFYWVVLLVVNIIATILEILSLYLDSLRVAAKICGYLGLDPWLMGYVSDMDHAATAIVRAAFELPHPSGQIMGIRPLRYSNRLNGFVRALLWKSKRGLTSLLVGMFLRRLVPRVAMKIASPFVAVPIAALWNSLVAWKVSCDIYSIVIGNIAIARVITKVVEPRWRRLSPTAKNLMYCVAGVEIALEQQIHPTLETLLRLLCRYWGDPPPTLPIDDKTYLESQLVDCPREEQLLILQLLAVAIVSNSHISWTPMKYLKNVVIACGLNPDEKGLDELRDQFRSKSSIDVDHITDLFRDAVTKDHSRSKWDTFCMMAKVLSYNIAY